MFVDTLKIFYFFFRCHEVACGRFELAQQSCYTETMSSESGRPSHELQNGSKPLKDSSRRHNTLRKAQPADDLRSRSSTNSDPAIRRQGETVTLPATKSVKEVVGLRKVEPNPPAKRSRECRTPPSSLPDDHETDISVNQPPSTADSASKKVVHESIGEPGAQRVQHGVSDRQNPQTNLQLSAPPGITATMLGHPSLRPEVAQTQTPHGCGWRHRRFSAGW